VLRFLQIIRHFSTKLLERLRPNSIPNPNDIGGWPEWPLAKHEIQKIKIETSRKTSSEALEKCQVQTTSLGQ